MIDETDLDKHDLQLNWQIKVVEHDCQMNW